MANTVVFLASISPTEAAIRYTGDGDGQRVSIDIPELQLGNSAGLLAMRRHLLRVTIEDLGPLSNYNLDALPLEAVGEAPDPAPNTPEIPQQRF